VFVCDRERLGGDLLTLAGEEGRHASTVRRIAGVSRRRSTMKSAWEPPPPWQRQLTAALRASLRFLPFLSSPTRRSCRPE